MGNKKLKTIKIVVPEKVRSGIYFNAMSVNASKNEVILDFILKEPSNEYRVISRLITSPKHVEEMSDKLKEIASQLELK